MPLTAGTRLGPYEIVAPLGAGGMGEVYRARDSRLGRDVAIKALPAEFARDPERLARFEREARLLASLNHPNVAGIHGVEDVGGTRYLVLEFVDGETLQARLKRGPLPLDETLDVARQVAAGVEAAHDSGVVHRDLKPGNIMFTPSGTVKVLDFGLARSGGSDRPGSDPSLSRSPTMTYAATQAGVILGTAAYMSPEQARGKSVDRRTDIWSFGCVLYECLTGRPLFEGETVSDLIAKILERAPDWSALPAATPRGLRKLLERCLRKDPRERLRDIGDARLELLEIDPHAPEPPATLPAAATARRAPAWVWAIVALAGAGAGLGLGHGLFARHASAPPLRRLTIAAPELRADFSSRPVTSPDGRRIAFTSGSRLWIRDLQSFESVEVPGTEDARTPFWSPDGSQLGFSKDRRLWITALSGSSASVLCTIPDPGGCNGADWGRDGKIVFAVFRGGLYEVPARGGEPRLVLAPDTAEVDFHHPDRLPDGEHVIAVAHAKTGKNPLAVISLRNGSRRDVGSYNAGMVVYSSTGHLLFDEETGHQVIMAVPFSAAKLKVSGEPFVVVAGASLPSISDDGALMTCAMGSARSLRELVRLDHAGRVEAVLGPPQRGMSRPQVSPNGASVVLVATDNDNADIWIQDLARGTRRRLVSGPRDEFSPAWVGNASVVYTVMDETDNVLPLIVEAAADGSSAPNPLGVRGYYPSVTRDGATMVFNTDTNGRQLLWRQDRGAQPVGLTRGTDMNEDQPALSPDGRWLAYMSDAAGGSQVFVRRLADGAQVQQVSRTAGEWPFWGVSGEALYYWERDVLMEARVRAGATLEVGEPRRVFSAGDVGVPGAGGAGGPPVVAIAGGGFLAVRRAASDQYNGVLAVENWFEEFRKR